MYFFGAQNSEKGKWNASPPLVGRIIHIQLGKTAILLVNEVLPWRFFSIGKLTSSNKLRCSFYLQAYLTQVKPTRQKEKKRNRSIDQFNGESLLSVATQSEFSPQLAHWSTQHSSTSGKRYPIPRRTTRCLAQLFMHVTIGELALLPAAVKKNIKVTGESTAVLFVWSILYSSVEVRFLLPLLCRPLSEEVQSSSLQGVQHQFVQANVSWHRDFLLAVPLARRLFYT